MFLIYSSLLFAIPVILKRRYSQKANSGSLAIVSMWHHWNHMNNRQVRWVRNLDRIFIYSNFMECILRSNTSTIIPVLICSTNAVILYYVGIKQFSNKPPRMHEILWSSGTFMHMLMHFNGLAAIVSV